MSKKIILNKEWKMQSSGNLSKFGEVISTTDFIPEDWYTVDVPTTVINGLILNDEFDFKDPYYGLNLKSIPGHKAHITQQNYESRYMPEDSPFRKSWWFRKEFLLERKNGNEETWIAFDGINYSANIWINGKRIAGSDHIIGTYRRYDFHVTPFVDLGKKNIIALEVFSPNPDDLGISFVDWNPLPPDDDMGIWHPVYVYMTGPVALKYPFVKSKLNIETLKEAELLISVELHNTQKNQVEAIVEGKIGEITFQKELFLSSYEKKEFIFSCVDFPQLLIKDPRIWWPYQLGSPELYKLDLIVKVNDEISDEKVINFGIRDVKSSINEYGSCVFTINGQNILIRGGGWTCDMMLHQSKERDEIDISFLKNLNMNTLRLEGKLGSDYFWEKCDREGILVLAGWVCCSHWEKWNNWKKGDLRVAKKSLDSQIRRLRNHPSLIAWLYGSDFPPPEFVEKVYLDVLKEHNELPIISSATAAPSVILGETGVKMSGPYTYVPPIYWYTKGKPGFAESFNTETGPDVCIPPYESLMKMLPENQLYIGSEGWNYHAGLGSFKNTEIIEETISKRYGKPKDIEDFTRTSQVLGYECWRAMFEAYGQNFPKATGVIGWMYNSAWPSLIWQLFDYYFNPNGAFYGSKKACELIHIQYSYSDASVWVINGTLNKKENLTVTVNLFNIDLEKKYSFSKKVNINGNDRKKTLTVPKIEGLSSVYFIQLLLEDGSIVLSENFYWLSLKNDLFEDKDEWYYSPVKEHADMSSLRDLLDAEIKCDFSIIEKKNVYEISLRITNISDVIAFFLRYYLIEEETNQFLTPVYWEDNCISILPSETREITGVFPKNTITSKVNVQIDGWNCRQTLRSEKGIN
ncbi:MAG: sugar-binding domain-containing protein [Promethearchaeota archaeon]